MLENMLEETNAELFHRRLSSEVESKARRSLQITTPLSRSRTLDRADSKQEDYFEADDNSYGQRRKIRNHRPLADDNLSEFSSSLSVDGEIKVFKESDEFDLIVRYIPTVELLQITLLRVDTSIFTF